MKKALAGMLAIAMIMAVTCADQQKLSIDLWPVDGQQSTIGISVTNPGQNTLSVLKWGTPFIDGAGSDSFAVVSASNESVEYIGPIYKRGSPVQEDFFVLGPGDSYKTVVNLEDLYSLQSNTTYAIGASMNVLASEFHPKLLTATINLTTVALTSTQTITITTLVNGRRGVKGGAVPLGCSSSRESIARDAVIKGAALASAAYSSMSGSSDAKYIKWFGTYASTTRYAVVTAGLNRIKNKLSSINNFNINCAPSACSSPSVFAYVIPSDSTYTINLCNKFWTASTTGFDSQGKGEPAVPP